MGEIETQGTRHVGQEIVFLLSLVVVAPRKSHLVSRPPPHLSTGTPRSAGEISQVNISV